MKKLSIFAALTVGMVATAAQASTLVNQDKIPTYASGDILSAEKTNTQNAELIRALEDLHSRLSAMESKNSTPLQKLPGGQFDHCTWELKGTEVANVWKKGCFEYTRYDSFEQRNVTYRECPSPYTEVSTVEGTLELSDGGTGTFRFARNWLENNMEISSEYLVARDDQSQAGGNFNFMEERFDIVSRDENAGDIHNTVSYNEAVTWVETDGVVTVHMPATKDVAAYSLSFNATGSSPFMHDVANTTGEEGDDPAHGAYRVINMTAKALSCSTHSGAPN